MVDVVPILVLLNISTFKIFTLDFIKKETLLEKSIKERQETKISKD